MRKIILILILINSAFTIQAKTLKIGAGSQYSNISNCLNDVLAGDTILFRSGVYPGNQFISELHGIPEKWITITVESGAEVVISGGSYAWMLTDASYIRISGFIFEKQTGNGLNIDDGATYETPSHHLIFENCIWRDMAATGNNDQLKLSGVDSSIVRNCTFVNGALNGSQIDMVGCHENIFENNHFEKAGSNSIQAKGGSSNIIIRSNKFIDCGQRSINIGGSTGLQYFRPLGVNYEASNIFVYSNVFIGSISPIAYVGAVNCQVINNTIITPGKWTIRILQENTQPEFQKCGNNSFINNIVYINNTAIPENSINIGSNTVPETFTFSNNLWYNYDNTSWSGPNKTFQHQNTLIGINPEFADFSNNDFSLLSSSKAIGKGLTLIQPTKDYLGYSYKEPRSIGAFEYIIASDNSDIYSQLDQIQIVPNPSSGDFTIIVESKFEEICQIIIYDIHGNALIKDYTLNLKIGSNRININYIDMGLSEGLYFLDLKSVNLSIVSKFIFVR